MKRIISLLLTLVLVVQPAMPVSGSENHKASFDPEFISNRIADGNPSAGIYRAVSDPLTPSEQKDYEVYPITYELDGGVNDENNPDRYSEEILPFGLWEPSKTGYVFDGWYTDLGKPDNEKTEIIESGTEGALVFFAVWEPVRYQVSYLGNGADSGSMGQQEFCYNSGGALAPNRFVKTGYRFDGWNTEPDGTGTAYTDRMTVMNLSETQDDIVELYAVWVPVSYSVRFHGNGATSGSMADQTRSYDDGRALTAAVYRKTGYTFAGWNTKTDGSGISYADKEKKNIRTEEGTAVLYAQWAKNRYTLTYHLNGGKNSSANPAAYDVTSAEIVLQPPSRIGYTFAGWYSDSAYKTRVTSIQKGSTGNRTFYARWTANRYTVRFDACGGTGTMKSMTVAYDTEKKLTVNGFKKAGYLFSGWASSKTGSVTYKDQAAVRNLRSKDGAEVTLYAVWTKKTYTVTYQPNGGRNNSANPVSYDVTTTTVTLRDPSRIGYTFAGWYSDAALKTRVTSIPKGSTGNRTFYARWTVNRYTVRFDAGGGTGTMNPMTGVAYGTKKALTENAFKRAGYTFAGWASSKTGNVKYKNGEKIRNLSAKNGKTVTLYAVWKPVRYTVRYKLNGGTNSSRNPSVYYVTTSTITLAAPVRTGYRFMGWYQEASFRTKVTSIRKGSTGSKTLYAKWEPVRYNIVYHLDGGTNNRKNPETFTVGDTVKLKKPTKSGYTFGGWFTDEDLTDQITEIPSGTVKTVHLYALWKGPVHLYRKNSFPVSVSYRSSVNGRIFTTTRFDKVTFRWSRNSQDGDYGLEIDCTGQKIYDYKGSSGTDPSISCYRITDSTGKVIKKGFLSRSGIRCGQRFTETTTIKNIPAGDYYIELYDFN